jgi:hypothetical protein
MNNKCIWTKQYVSSIYGGYGYVHKQCINKEEKLYYNDEENKFCSHCGKEKEIVGSFGIYDNVKNTVEKQEAMK